MFAGSLSPTTSSSPINDLTIRTTTCPVFFLEASISKLSGLGVIVIYSFKRLSGSTKSHSIVPDASYWRFLLVISYRKSSSSPISCKSAENSIVFPFSVIKAFPLVLALVKITSLSKPAWSEAIVKVPLIIKVVVTAAKPTVKTKSATIMPILTLLFIKNYHPSKYNLVYYI